MDKARRKEILHQLSEQQTAAFRRSLPIDEHMFPKLFDYVDERLSEQACNDDFAVAGEFCEAHQLDKEPLFDWIRSQGAYCDCELYNLEGNFQYLHPPVSKPTGKPPVSRQKLNSLRTDFGFAISKIPTPWMLIETVTAGKTTHTFQIGKGTDCIVSLERSFPVASFTDDQYWIGIWLAETGLRNNLDGLAAERFEVGDYSLVTVKSKNWTPVKLWCTKQGKDSWYLRMSTELSRYKGDLKAFEGLVTSVE